MSEMGPGCKICCDPDTDENDSVRGKLFARPPQRRCDSETPPDTGVDGMNRTTWITVAMAAAMALPTLAMAKSDSQVYIADIQPMNAEDRKSTRLNSSHVSISYAV